MGVKVRFTYEDYAALPDNGKRYQLVEGDLVMSPSPSLRHQHIVMRLGSSLHAHALQRGLGTVYSAPTDVIMAEDEVYQPDLVFVSNANGRMLQPDAIHGAPDLCVEILSQHNRKIDLQVKRKSYARHGVLEYWIVDPDADTLTVYALQDDPETPLRTLGPSDALSSALLPGLDLELAPIFAR